MTAYSFGNKWMGIIALSATDPPEPLHRMAQRPPRLSGPQTARVANQKHAQALHRARPATAANATRARNPSKPQTPRVAVDSAPMSRLIQHCKAIGCEHTVEVISNGTKHRAEWTFGPDKSAVWRGPWAPTKGAAKIEAAAQVLDVVSLHATGAEVSGLTPETMIRHAFLTAEIAAAKSANQTPSIRLGSQYLLSGSFSDFEVWSEPNENLLQLHSASVDPADLRQYYADVIRQGRRDALMRALRPAVSFAREFLRNEGLPFAKLLESPAFGILRAVEVMLPGLGAATSPAVHAAARWRHLPGVELGGINEWEETAVLVPGSWSVVDQIVALASAVSSTFGSPLCVQLAADDHGQPSVALTIAGVDLPVTLAAPSSVAATVSPGVRFERVDATLVVKLPIRSGAPGLFVESAVHGIVMSLSDDWLHKLWKDVSDATAEFDRQSTRGERLPERLSEAVRRLGQHSLG